VGNLKAIIISALIGFVIGGISVWTITTAINNGRDRDTDRELADLRSGYNELESNYFAIRATKDELVRISEARRNLDARTRLEVEGIGRTISQAQSQVGTIQEKVRSLIVAMQEIKKRCGVVEDYLNSVGYYNSD
jgi:septation ring formation regulator EzrA